MAKKPDLDEAGSEETWLLTRTRQEMVLRSVRSPQSSIYALASVRGPLSRAISLDEFAKRPWLPITMLSVLRKARLKDKEMRILMLGLDNAGKTTIVKKLLEEDVNTVSPTLGFIIKTIDFEGCRYSHAGNVSANSERYKLNIWDVGGQKTLRSYWRNYFEKTDALVWVVDASDRIRIDDCRDELAGLLVEERLMGATLLVFLNKTDIPGGLSVEETQEALGLDHLLTHRWVTFPCSAMTGANLREGLQWLVEDAKQRLFLY